MLIYADTNVILNMTEKRSDSRRPTYEITFDMFQRGLNCAFSIVRSDHLDFELQRHGTPEKVALFWKYFETARKVVRVDSDKTIKINAQAFNHPDDAKHALIAKKANADYLITENFKDFEDCLQLVKILPAGMI